MSGHLLRALAHADLIAIHGGGEIWHLAVGPAGVTIYDHDREPAVRYAVLARGAPHDPIPTADWPAGLWVDCAAWLDAQLAACLPRAPGGTPAYRVDALTLAARPDREE